MKPALFDYIRADTREEAIAALAEWGDEGRILAGGQSLMPLLNMRLSQPQVLIDISRTADLDYVARRDDYWAIGAAATQARVERDAAISREVPLLGLVLPRIAHSQIRSRGTVCGSLAHADPSAELPLCLVALGGEVVLHCDQGSRVVKAEDFFQGALLTSRHVEELLEEARFPVMEDNTRYAFDEVAMRHGDFALVALAAVQQTDRTRLAVGGVSDRPMVREWAAINAGDLDDALNDFAWELDARDDQHASAAYRRQVVRAMGKRLLSEVMSDAAH
jgi:2-furoyl-CoA dehydrogenase FAD binding subunit